MEDGFRLQDTKIAIVGLGLMGGSLALALRGKCAALYGIDAHPATLELALDKKIVDQGDTDPAKLLPPAELIILATPVSVIIDYIKKLPLLTQNTCIVLDLGSTKRDIINAMSALPEWFDPIGGHPICGKEKLGLENAEGGLYRDTPFVITTLERTSLRAKSAIKQILSAIGARLIEADAEEHDRTLAFTSHLPFILSSALALSTPTDYSSFMGTGFRSTSRLAGTPSHMMMGVLKSNKENILLALRKFQEQLASIELALSDKDDISLGNILNSAQSHYQSMIH